MDDAQDRHAELFHRWRTSYEADAEADEYGEWMDEYEFQEEPLETARERLENTVALLGTIVTYRRLDNADFAAVEALLSKQTYRSRDSSARYVVYFAWNAGEVFVDRLDEIDLVDIYSTIGFGAVGIALRDSNEELQAEEREKLEQAILEDFYFDYGEDEISIVFDRSGSGVFADVNENTTD